MSGLRLYVEKTEFISAVIPENQVAALESVTGFSRGTLPVRYLGVPLFSSKLTTQESQALTNRITSRIHGPPSSFLMLVPQACSSFLWKGELGQPKCAKIKWTNLCYSKREGILCRKEPVAHLI